MTHTSLPHTGKKGGHTVALFLSPSDSPERACTHKQEHTHTLTHSLTQPKEQTQKGLYGCCVDPRSCENLRSVSPPPSHVLLLSALIPSLCRNTWLEGRGSGAPLHRAEAEFGVQERTIEGAGVVGILETWVFFGGAWVVWLMRAGIRGDSLCFFLRHRCGEPKV